jgi:flagellar L-ring protein precursor FlgH
MLGVLLLPLACNSANIIGKPPPFSNPQQTQTLPRPNNTSDLNPRLQDNAQASASLWSRNRQSLFGDQRAIDNGDILTVVIEIDEKAEISNATSSNRDGSQTLKMPQIFGWPQRIKLPDGASFDEILSTDSNSKAKGSGSVRRTEKLTLRIAATITDVLPNGILSIQGSQEVRVNFELRELLVSGFVRPVDISRKNEITYDKIASARISYGGRGQITDVQQPRYGQQILDTIRPF